MAPIACIVVSMQYNTALKTLSSVLGPGSTVFIVSLVMSVFLRVDTALK